MDNQAIPREVDAALHSIRIAARSLDGKQQSDLSTARFNLWQSLDAGEFDAARAWLDTIRTAAAVTNGDLATVLTTQIDRIATYLASNKPPMFDSANGTSRCSGCHMYPDQCSCKGAGRSS